MEAIFSSKLYKSSKRKDKIHSAVQDPLNAPLEQQLRSYLDPEYQTTSYLERPESDVFQEDSGDDVVPESGADNNNFAPPPTGGHSAHTPPPMDFTEAENPSEDEDDSENPVDTEDADLLDETTDEGDAALEQSTHIASNKKSVQASTDLKCAVNELKGLLNSRDDTCGVSRISVRDSELWIHYNDSISLNNVMDKVIDLVYVSGYNYLSFDRLARSENAVVFQIVPASTDVNRSSSDEKQK